MASTSVLLSNQKSFKYDVFLSFRGEDTRKNFVDHLYHALTQQGIDTYRDDEEIKKGKRIREQLFRSIEDSKLYIIVCSKKYASSSWCLDELVKIMECQEMDEHTAFVVFYDVEPTEVRKQIGAVGEAFSKHQGQESAGKWREALRASAGLAGWELKATDDGHEAKFIQRIVKEISLELRFSSWSADPELIGMEKRVEAVVSSLEVNIDDVRMIGIKGMGGGGKTTLAKAVFDQIAYLYEGSSFVANVRESTKVSGWNSLQKQVLSDVLLNDPDINVNGFSDLKSMMKKKLRSRKVLLVLDDVNHKDQLEALAGETDWFKSGSRIIITTRDEQVLISHGVIKKLILDANLLSHGEASCLFSRRAFGRVIPDYGFEMLSDQVLSYANGLPLTIKVLGSFLRGKDEHEWIDALERLKEIPLKDTLDILELSYNSLEEDYKEIFLDVTCILKGSKKEYAIIALESCGFHARIGLKVLEQKSLITVSDNGHLTMHDHIEEMGKNIVRRLHPNEPSKHSRLWIEKEIKEMLVENKGTPAARCIIFHTFHSVFVMKGLEKMKELRFLSVRCMRKATNLALSLSKDHTDDSVFEEYNKDSIFLPNSLQYLHLCGYVFRCLPISFHANNLVGLYLSECNFNQLWEGERKALKKLKFIEFHYCKLRTFDVKVAPNMERLKLNWCVGLVDLRIPAESFKLKFISIKSCWLKTLDLARAQNLQNLHLHRCKNLEELLMPINSLKLEFVDINRCCKPKTLDLAGAKNHDIIHKECSNLVVLQMPLECLKLKDLSLCNSKLKTLNLHGALNLQSLYLFGCEDLEELHMPINILKLESVDIIRCCKLKTLDLAGTQNLGKVRVEGCHDLVVLKMPLESLKLKDLSLRDSKLKVLNLQGALNLQSLYLLECEDLEELHMPINIFKLESIDIIRCCKLKTLDLARTQNLGKVWVDGCQDLVVLKMPLESLNLKDLFLCNSKLKNLNLQGAMNLQSVYIFECKALEELHMPINILKLDIICCCKLKTLDLASSQNLGELRVKGCQDLVVLKMPLENLKLKDLFLRNPKLETLNLQGAMNLQSLYLLECEALEELYMPINILRLDIVRCCKLKTLDLVGTQNLGEVCVDGCQDLVVLKMPLESPKLKDLFLCNSKLKTLNLQGAMNLRSLYIFECEALEELHMPMNILKLDIIRCCKLKTLDLASTQNLGEVRINGCQDLVVLKMPRGILKLKDLFLRNSKLKTLNLQGAMNLQSLYLLECPLWKNFTCLSTF